MSLVEPTIVQLPVGDDAPTARLYYGQPVLETLRELPDSSVHVCCTSPPYWGLRDYGVAPQEWPEVTFCPMVGVPEMTVPAQSVAFGLEADPMHYIAHMVLIYRELRRVLRPDGTAWLNLGDSYTRNPQKGVKFTGSTVDPYTKLGVRPETPPIPDGLKPKNLMLIPHRAAFALQADGWVVRSDIVWAKGACMPEPVKDRCTMSHESVFMLAASNRYFYDAHAVREPQAADTEARYKAGFKDRYGNMKDNLPFGYRGPAGGQKGMQFNPSGRNRRTVWNVNPRPYPGAHFAVWPPELVEPMVKAGSSEKGVCGVCGAPYRRLVGKGEVLSTGGSSKGSRATNMDQVSPLGQDPETSAYNTGDMVQRERLMLGWEPTCDHEDAEVVRAVVMDIFSGSATTGMVALNLGRDYIGIDLQDDYLKLAEARLVGRKPPGEAAEPDEGDIFDLFGGD